jgi:hypothetical protein
MPFWKKNQFKKYPKNDIVLKKKKKKKKENGGLGLDVADDLNDGNGL